MLRGKVMSVWRCIGGEVKGAAGGAGRQEGKCSRTGEQAWDMQKKKRHLQEVEVDLCGGE